MPGNLNLECCCWRDTSESALILELIPHFLVIINSILFYIADRMKVIRKSMLEDILYLINI